MKTAGVVVTYNRKEELVKNIRAMYPEYYCLRDLARFHLQPR